MSWYFSPSVVCSLAVSFLTIYSNCVLIDTCFSSNIMPEIHVVYAILKTINAIMPHCFKWYQSKRSNQLTGRSIKIRRQKRGENMWNRSRNTTVITCLSCRFGEVYLLQRNRTTFSHVSVRFQLKQRDVSAGVTSCYVSGNTLFSRFRWRDQTKCRRKYWVTFRKQTFLMFLLNYSGLEGTETLVRA